MTDKVQLIKEELERRISQFESKYPKDLGGYWNDEESAAYDCAEEYKRFLLFIDSLPKEPKKQPKFKVGDTIKGPCNNIFQVKEVLDKQYLLHSENGDELNSIEIVDKYSCISEEPASEDLKKEISKWRNHYISVLDNNLRIDLRDIEVTANHFAEWQKNKMKEAMQTEYEKGRFDMREEMMKTLVGGEIVKDIHNQLSVKSEPLNDTFGDIKFGDKVKVKIINKED